jgi:putative spermidine/putrescine transport system substrate-binding protein
MYYSYANVLTYNKELTGDNPPTSWADFFDLEKYPGGRAIYGSVTDLYGVVTAALGRGVAVDKVFPLDMDANLAKLDEIRDQIIWYESNEQCPQMVDSGEAIMGVCLNGRNTNAVADGATNIAWDWHQSEMSFGEVAIPKGIPESHLQPAQKFVAFMLSKEQNGRLSDYIAYGPTNTEATYVNSELEQDLPSSHYDDEHVEFDWAWQNSEEGVAALEKYAAWRQGG